MKILPKVVRACVNTGMGTSGSYLDSEWVLHYIAAGTWEFQLGPDVYTVTAGDMVLLPPRRLHLVRVLSGKKLVQYVVHFDLNDTALRSRPLALAIEVSRGNHAELLRLNRLLRQEWESGRHESGLISSGYLAAMLGIYFRHMPSAKHSASAEGCHWPNIEDAIRFIQSNYQNPQLNLAGISAAARLSPNYFCAVFKAGTGFSVKRYLLAFRLEKAEEFLMNSRFNCSEIAEASGFSSIHRFSRVFRENKKLSPTAYRALYERI